MADQAIILTVELKMKILRMKKRTDRFRAVEREELAVVIEVRMLVDARDGWRGTVRTQPRTSPRGCRVGRLKAGYSARSQVPLWIPKKL
jgi:hypothetical protein